MKRRMFLSSILASLGLGSASQASKSKSFEVTRTDAEWRARLSPLEYRVMRKHGTERAFSSPLDKETRSGLFRCRGCDLPLYDAAHKYDSGTGWPSFYKALPNAIGTSIDRSFLMVRTECHCARCGSHLGHIFNDGPRPTGKRHCINGVSLRFVPA